MNTTDRYSERIRYDKNSNVSNVARYGMNNLRSYGVIDSLEITRSGNQLVAIEDHAEKNLTYDGASDFVDGITFPQEYTYDGNGRLTKDMNRGIWSITYDLCNNPQAITFTGTNGIEYAYAPDGTRLRTVHKVSGIGGSVTRDTTDYLGNLVMRNGHLGTFQFEGGYVSFSNDTIDGWYYYIQDYMGNNRMVVNRSGTTEQITHYYPYGGVIGDISTNENVQKYKFESKELDRTFGLDNYDIHARQYFAMMPSWDRIDPLAEKYYGISPYAYCGGDPVNFIDRNGMQPGILEEISFALHHPIETYRIGAGVTKGAQNISTNATRFATRGNILFGTLSYQEERGSEVGAYRHALWQASIASEFGANIAKQAGDAHEDNPKIDMNQTIFKTIDEADQSADLHNNIIGREIGVQNHGNGMKTIAIAVLDEFLSNGLYVVQKNESGYDLVKTRLDPSTYKILLDIFKQLNDNGRYEYEQDEYDAQQEDRTKRFDAMQNAM